MVCVYSMKRFRVRLSFVFKLLHTLSLALRNVMEKCIHQSPLWLHKEYRPSLLLGLVVSVGGITEHTAKDI